MPAQDVCKSFFKKRSSHFLFLFACT
jgi:hypothetical protein